MLNCLKFNKLVPLQKQLKWKYCNFVHILLSSNFSNGILLNLALMKIKKDYVLIYPDKKNRNLASCSGLLSTRKSKSGRVEVTVSFIGIRHDMRFTISELFRRETCKKYA